MNTVLHTARIPAQLILDQNGLSLWANADQTLTYADLPKVASYPDRYVSESRNRQEYERTGFLSFTLLDYEDLPIPQGGTPFTDDVLKRLAERSAVWWGLPFDTDPDDRQAMYVRAEEEQTRGKNAEIFGVIRRDFSSWITCLCAWIPPHRRDEVAELVHSSSAKA